MLISITSSLHVITILLTNLLQSLAITNSHPLKRHIDSFSDWEVGLRESTYHALIRERHIRHPHLKEYLYSAPLLGRQDTATPFGDIAIVARGQLYSAPGGFQFVQDPYQNDCDGCHNTPLQCDRAPCEYWRPQDHERLLALWTVKRIRHRDSQYGFRYDFEYKISPMSSINGKPFITRHGNFDYGIEGHKFVVQRDPGRLNLHDTHSYKHVYDYPPYHSDNWVPHYHDPNLNSYLPPLLPPITDDYSDEDPRNQPYGPNGQKDIFYKPEVVPTGSTTTKQTTSPSKDDDDIYNNAIGTLTSKFTTRHLPSTTMKTTDESEFLFPHQKPTTQTKTGFLPTRPTTDKKPILTSTRKMQIPTTKETTPPTYISESTRFVQYSEPDPLYRKLTTPTTGFLPTIPRKPPKQFISDTLSDNDYNVELFGERSTTPKTTSAHYTHYTNDYMLFGEQAITIVSPPSIPLKDPSVIDRFNTESTTTQKTTQEQATTTAKTTAIKPIVIPTKQTTPRTFFITRKPVLITTPTIEKQRTVTNNHITTSVQKIKPVLTTAATVLDEDQQSTQSIPTTLTSIDNNTVINFSTSTYTTSGTEIQSTTSFETEPSFETTTEKILTTETPRPVTTTTPKIRTRIKTTPKLTTHYPVETSAMDDNIFQLNFFGNNYMMPTVTTYLTYPTPTSSSDLDDIFGKHAEQDSIESTPKIIFSNFYLPTQIHYSAETTLTTSADVEYTEDAQNGTTGPATSQSYITSVSFEVNKKKSTPNDNSDEYKSTGNSLIDNTSVPLVYTDKDQLTEITQSSRILDTLTMSVLSHAKSITYLNDEQNENSTVRSKRSVKNKRKLKTSKTR